MRRMVFIFYLPSAKKGALIIADNVVRNGAILEKDSLDVNVLGRSFLEKISKDTRLDSVGIQTVGKGVK